jgi:hypothetical protein
MDKYSSCTECGHTNEHSDDGLDYCTNKGSYFYEKSVDKASTSCLKVDPNNDHQGMSHLCVTDNRLKRSDS